MKKNINVIQIKGIRGLIIVAFVVTCLFAGFVIFPGLVAMKLWNIASSYTIQVPSIGLFQGVLLWGIIAGAYFTFKKDKFVVCMKTPEGLSEEELKAVFEDVKKQAQNDKIIQAMLKARETEIRMKQEEKSVNTDSRSLPEQQNNDKIECREEIHNN